VTLTCLVTAANPAVSEYRFYLNDTMRNTSKSNSLTIIDVQRSKHYGKYKCVAHNDVGDGQSNEVVLNINGKCLSMRAKLIHLNLSLQTIFTVSLHVSESISSQYSGVSWRYIL